jgi:hypothetical protein
VTASGPSDPTRAALARKYAALVELRRRRDEGGDPAGGGRLPELAAEFPGCLRELDTLGRAELERRAAACAAADGPDEPWMAWIAGYHALMRAALAVRVAPGARGGSAQVASQAAGFPVDDAFVRDVLTPPGGRMGVVVLRALAARFGVPAATIAAALFPVRRPSPYQL